MSAAIDCLGIHSRVKSMCIGYPVRRRRTIYALPRRNRGLGLKDLNEFSWKRSGGAGYKSRGE